jgi:hypothetical protein
VKGLQNGEREIGCKKGGGVRYARKGLQEEKDRVQKGIWLRQKVCKMLIKVARIRMPAKS